MRKTLLVVLFTLCAGCATPYQPSGATGGFTDLHVDEDVYRIRFSGNGFATRETAQTYWLYRAAELTLEKGFAGFEILSPIALGALDIGVSYKPAAYVPIFIPNGNVAPKPTFEADIQLLPGPVRAAPPRVFDAAVLKEQLEPYVKSEKKCDRGNVCPHIKRYLRPAEPGGTTGKPATAT